MAVIQKATSEIVNSGRFAYGFDVTEVKLGEIFSQWLDDEEVFVFYTKQWLVWHSSF